MARRCERSAQRPWPIVAHRGDQAQPLVASAAGKRRPFARVLATLALLCGAQACGPLRHLSSSSSSASCEGACDHYIDCKPRATTSDQARCLRECPQVFSDAESLSAFMNLSCPDTLGFVDGDPAIRADNEAAAPTSTQTER